jgi:hypothetical protein
MGVARMRPSLCSDNRSTVCDAERPIDPYQLGRVRLTHHFEFTEITDQANYASDAD